MRGLGYVEDKPDVRDLTFGVASVPIPGSHSCERLLPPVLDQGPLNSCVAHGVAEAVFASHEKQGFDATICSRNFLWNLTRSYEQTLSENVGVSIRDCMAILNWFGFCPESAFPYDAQEDPPLWTRQPPPAAFRAAFDQRSQFAEGVKPAVYHRIEGDGGQLLQAIRVAVASDLPVIFGVPVSEAFVDGRFDPFKPCAPPATSIGKHCMLVVGYQGREYRVRNSWGPGWGDSGSCLFSEDYLIQSLDRWTVNHAPIYSTQGS